MKIEIEITFYLKRIFFFLLNMSGGRLASNWIHQATTCFLSFYRKKEEAYFLSI
jgi:hypothetical protein